MSGTESISLLILITNIVITVINFFNNRKDKSNKDTKEDSYKQGILDEKLSNIMDKLDKIEAKLDSYDNEIDTRIAKALDNHIAIYHKKG